MKPMKIVRRKRQDNNGKKIIIVFIVIGIIALLVAAFLLFRNYSCNSMPYSTTQEVETAKTCMVNDEEKVSMTLSESDVCMITLPDDSLQKDAVYTSSSDEILRVDSAGRVDALQEGEAMITVISNSFEGYCHFVVEAKKDIATNDEATSSAILANEEYLNMNLEENKRNPYMLQVNRKTNVVTAFTYDNFGKYKVPVRSMVCSCGSGEDELTPLGSFSISYKSRWNPLDGDCFGQYISGFYGDILFHSVPYDTKSPDDLKVDEFNKLGENASMGCVRLCVADAKWIYDNCDIYTEVNVIEKDEKEDLLGKPETMKIPSSIKWDPTDPDEDNPYSEKFPEITEIEDKEISVDDIFDPLENVKATDTCGNDITDKINLVGNVISGKKGIYYLTYSVTDGIGKKFEKTIKIEVN